jgi:Tol biopolymer transport system component
VYLTDLTTGATTLVDRAAGASGAVANGFSSHPAVSGDGRFVAFSSAARNLGAHARGVRVYVRDVRNGTTTFVSSLADGAGFEPSISGDGARVAYTSTRGGRSRVLVYDGATGKATAVSGSKGISFDPALSGDGTRVAFASNRRDLAATRSTGARTVYVRDLTTGRTSLVSGGPAAG